MSTLEKEVCVSVLVVWSYAPPLLADFKRSKEDIDQLVAAFKSRREVKTSALGLDTESKAAGKSLPVPATFSVPAGFLFSLPKGLLEGRLAHPFVLREEMRARLDQILQWQLERWPTVSWSCCVVRLTGCIRSCV